MDNKFKEYKDDFIKDNFFSKGAEIEVGEYKKYNKEEKADIYVEKSADETRYYKKDIFELSDEELALGIKIENYKMNEQMNKNIETLKFIMVFLLILTIASSFIFFYTAAR